MPPRKVATRSSIPRQTILSFKTPAKITKSQVPHSGAKKDIISSTKKQATPPPPSPPADAVDIVPTAPLEEIVEPETVVKTKEEEEEEEEEHIDTSYDKYKIKAYYKQHILGTRRIPPVHQEELSLEEKVLRHFDLSSQYGPCIGISRVMRWKRAERLGMAPPEEVLAVCLKMEEEMSKKEKDGGSGEVFGCGMDRMRDTRRSYLDDYLSTRTVKE